MGGVRGGLKLNPPTSILPHKWGGGFWLLKILLVLVIPAKAGIQSKNLLTFFLAILKQECLIFTL